MTQPKPAAKPKRKAEPYTPAWERKANSVARSYVEMVPCKTCGEPRISTYRCTFCGKE